MSHRIRRPAATAVAVTLALTYGGCAADGPRADLEAVAGGGSQLPGYVTAVAVHDRTVALIGLLEDRTPVLWRVEGEELTETPLPELESMVDVAVASDGSVLVVDGSGIWRVSGSGPQLEVADDDAQEPAARTEDGDIRAVTVDSAGSILWTAVGREDRTTPADPHVNVRHPIRVRRLDGDRVTTVAGADEPVADSDEELFERQRNPPAQARARGFPMISPGPDRGLAADSSGIYMLGGGHVLRVSPDGGITKHAGGNDDERPEQPFTDEGPALERNLVVDETSGISASDGRVVVVDFLFSGQFGNNDSFDWTGDFTDGQQQLVDEIRGARVHDGRAVLVEDGRATSAAVHVKEAALDGDRLYLVGQADGGRNEAILVRTRVPGWR